MVKTKEILQSFTGYTSLHGIGRVGEAKFWCHKLAWTIFFLSSFGFCTYQISRLAKTYTEYPISTKMTISQGPLLFPAVTICNLNLVQYDYVLTDPNLFQIIEELSKMELLEVNLSEFSLDPIPKFSYAEPLGLAKDDPDDDVKAVTDALQLFNVRIADLSDTKMLTATEETDIFIIGCNFKGAKCDNRNFSRYRDDSYGLCHQFDISDYTVFVPGKDIGLELLISVNQVMYTPFITKSAGVRIALHHHDEKPDMTNKGINIATGFEVDLKVTAVEHTRVAGPKKRCDDSDTWPNVHACITNCTAFEAAAKCGCTTSRSIRSSNGVGLCLTLADVGCHRRQESLIMSSHMCRDCKVPCSEKSYKNSYSVTKFPAKRYEPILKTTLFHMLDVSADYNSFRDDVLLFRVYFPSLTTETITEERSYTDENFVSDIGGQLGLWIGMSVLSMTEVFELVVLLVAACFKRNRKTENLDDGSANGVPDVRNT